MIGRVSCGRVFGGRELVRIGSKKHHFESVGDDDEEHFEAFDLAASVSNAAGCVRG